jgi:WXG100 family type VII secretion target
MTDIKVTFASAQAKADELDAEANKIKQLLEQETALVSAISAQWDGQGAASWAQQQAEWQKEAGEEVEALNRLSAAVRQALGLMKDTETQVSGLFS